MKRGRSDASVGVKLEAQVLEQETKCERLGVKPLAACNYDTDREVTSRHPWALAAPGSSRTTLFGTAYRLQVIPIVVGSAAKATWSWELSPGFTPRCLGASLSYIRAQPAYTKLSKPLGVQASGGPRGPEGYADACLLPQRRVPAESSPLKTN